MSTVAAALRPAPIPRSRELRDDPAAQAFLLLRIAFTVAPILFGLDKFANVLTRLDAYLAPSSTTSSPAPPPPRCTWSAWSRSSPACSSWSRRGSAATWSPPGSAGSSSTCCSCRRLRRHRAARLRPAARRARADPSGERVSPRHALAGRPALAGVAAREGAAGVRRGRPAATHGGPKGAPMPATEPTRPRCPTSCPRRCASASPTSPARSPSSRSSARAPRLEYVAFAQGCARGVTRQGARRRRVGQRPRRRATRPTADVLLYEGEEVLGAQQNRTFDVSVLVARRVERARAGELRRARPLGRLAPRRGVRAAPQAAYPALRRHEEPRRHARRRPRAARRRARRRARCGTRSPPSRRGMDVAPRPARCTTSTRTGAAACATFAERDPRSTTARSARSSRSAGEFAVLDLVSRPDAFARAARPARPGLRARRARGRGPRRRRRGAVARRDARSCDASLRPASPEHDGIGLGRDAALHAGGRGGAGLVAGDELMQLTAFADEPGAPAPRARIRRPSRRR